MRVIAIAVSIILIAIVLACGLQHYRNVDLACTPTPTQECPQ